MKNKSRIASMAVIAITIFIAGCFPGRIDTPLPTLPPLPDDSLLGCYPRYEGLVSVWRADDSAIDQKSENNGKLSSGVAFVEGVAGKAFSFDGDNFVSAPTTGFPVGSNDRTLELWVYLSSVHKGESFFAGYGNFGSSDQSFHLGATAQTLFFSQWGEALFGPDLEEDRWYHVAVTNVGNVVTLYLDGETFGQSELTINTPEGTRFFIGGLPADSSKRLEGLVDEVAVYNRALTPEEIRSIYKAGQQGQCD